MSSADCVRTQPVVAALEPVPQSAPRARAVVRDALAGSSAEAVLDLAELCVSELVTNAVLHAGTQLRLEVSIDVDRVRLSVSDQSGNAPVLTRHTRTASTGRGLAMVAAVADAWGVLDDPAGGKTVWCLLSDHRGADAELDITDVLDAWGLSAADLPEPLDSGGSRCRPPRW